METDAEPSEIKDASVHFESKIGSSSMTQNAILTVVNSWVFNFNPEAFRMSESWTGAELLKA